jgi:RNA polymerase primary sigma factor|tara:strand:+ start:1701 stop:2675 length:975 start_codon:yes stop_codon:yes gene_type:complete
MQNNTLQKYLNEVSEIETMSAEEELKLASLERGDAEQKLVESNLKLVIYIAKQYKASSNDLQDLISEGNHGLMIAAERYDFEKGNKFSTFAAFYVKSKIREFIYKKNRSIAIPLGAVNKYFKIKKAEEAMAEELGRPPTVKELSQKVGVAETQIVNLKQSMTDSSSLDQQLSSKNEDDLTLADLIKDDTQNFVRDIEDAERSETLLECVNNLNDRERDIICHRFGLFGAKIKTLDEIGKEYDLTKERVRQIQESSLSRIKLAMHTGRSVSEKNSNLLSSETETRKEIKATRPVHQKAVRRVKKSTKQEQYWDSLKGERFNMSSI